MSNQSMRACALIACVGGALPMAASAGGGFVGIGVGYGPDYEGSDDYEVLPAPFGMYRWDSGRYVSLGGTSGSEKAGRLEANLISKDWSDLFIGGPVLQYRMERDDVDNDNVDDMRKVDAATEAGLFFGVNTGSFEATVTYATDVSSEHDGYLIYLNGAYTYSFSEKLSLKTALHWTYADDDYMETYFGVTPGDSARSGLPTYKTSSGGKDSGINFTANYALNKTWGLLGGFAYHRMLKDAEDSPLVNNEGDKHQYKFVGAVTYSF